MAAPNQQRGRWVAIVTGIVSVLIGVAYLALITVLDARGPMLRESVGCSPLVHGAVLA